MLDKQTVQWVLNQLNVRILPAMEAKTAMKLMSEQAAVEKQLLELLEEPQTETED